MNMNLSAFEKKNLDFYNHIAWFALQPKNAMYRSAVQKASREGLPVLGDQTRQTFSSAFIEEALLLSDLFDMSEIAAVELLMAGETLSPRMVNWFNSTIQESSLVLFLYSMCAFSYFLDFLFNQKLLNEY